MPFHFWVNDFNWPLSIFIKRELFSLQALIRILILGIHPPPRNTTKQIGVSALQAGTIAPKYLLFPIELGHTRPHIRVKQLG